MKAKDYNRDWSMFKVDADSPSGLVWAKGRLFKGTLNVSRIGKPVGSILKTKNNKYWVVGVSDGSFMIHRIIFVMENGFVDEESDIDHFDGDGLNNSPDNLRVVSKSVNSRNCVMRSDNSSGFNRVSYVTTRTGSGYQARFKRDGKAVTKFYSDKKYGDKAAEMAVDWLSRQSYDLDYYTERHGKEKRRE